MTLRTALIVSLIISLKSFSQIKFEKGYFIDNNGIKTECFIKNIDWNYNPRTFEYKASQNADPKNNTIRNVSEFSILGESKYKRFKVSIDRSSNRISKLRMIREPQFKEETLFLKVLVEGEASLFSYKENNLERFFYSVQNSAVEQLIYKLYKLEDNKVGKNNRFRQQLWSEVRCENITMGQVENVDYYKNDLKRYFITYNSCIDPNYKNIKENRSLKEAFRFTLRPGINLSRTTLDNNLTSRRREEIDYGTNLGARIGFEAEYIFPFNKNKWSACIEPTFQYHKVDQKELTYIPSSLILNTLVSSMDYMSIEIPLGIRHSFFMNDHSRIFINAAYVVDIPLNSKFQLNLANGNSFENLKISSGQNFAFGAGYNYKNKYSVEFRFLTDRELLIDFVNKESKHGTLSFIFGYTLF